MKYFSHILLISVFIISLLSINDIYAAGDLSISQDTGVIGHSIIVYCTGCVPDPIEANLTSNGAGLKTFDLHLIAGTTSDYASEFIKLCSSNCAANDFPTSVGATVSVDVSGHQTQSIVVENTEQSWDANYKRNPILIQPWQGVCDFTNPYTGGDEDGDGICDKWEDGTNNSLYPNECDPVGLCIKTNLSSKIYSLSCTSGSDHWSDMCPKVDIPDIYYEIDYMKGHKPSETAISVVADVFSHSNYIQNGKGGINLHVQLDEELPHFDLLKWQGTQNNPGYLQLKYWYFGTPEERTYSFPQENPASNWLNNGLYGGSERSEKAQAFHYMIFGHQLSAADTDPNTSGASELPGNDAVITLGSFSGMVGDEQQQQGTLLHEMGHTLKLRHGGFDNVNCKPNYFSVMSYAFQFPTPVEDRRFDFSRLASDDLDKNNLIDADGISQSIPPGMPTAYGPPQVLNTNAGVSIDWDRGGQLSAPIDINNFGIADCDGTDTTTTLEGFRDWHTTAMLLAPTGVPDSTAHDTAKRTRGLEGSITSGILTASTLDSEEGSEGEGSTISDAGPATSAEQTERLLDEIPMNDTAKAYTTKEITSDDVISLQIQEIDKIWRYADLIPPGNFTDSQKSKDQLKRDLEEVKNLIRSNVNGTNTLVNAYKKLDEIYLELSDPGEKGIIKPNSPYLKSLKDKVTDEIISLSYSNGGAGDFLNKGRGENMRPTIIPKPNDPPEIIPPGKLCKGDLALKNCFNDLICKDGREPAIRLFKNGTDNDVVCLFPHHKQEMIANNNATEMWW